MRTLITCLIVTCGALSSGLCQQSPLSDLNYETIEEFMSSPSEYDALMERMLAEDETLTLRDYALLYYGFSYRDDYDPDMFLFEKDEMMMLLAEEKYGEAYDFCKQYMNEVPLSLAGLNIYGMSVI